MLPINPDVLNTHITLIVGLSHHPQNARVINRIVRKRALQMALARAARMEMRRVRDQRLAGTVWEPRACQMRVIEGQCQSSDVAYLTAAVPAIAFHPPSRTSMTDALLDYYSGKPLVMA